jgi:Transposase and inactivated derivatives
MKQEIVHIGIDVSKEQLDIFDPVSGQNRKVPNSVQGFRAIRDMARRRKAIACCEPTGGLEHDLVLFLQRARVPVACCDAFRVRHYALSTGEFSKNDPLDARMISRFADATKPKVLEPRDLRVRELRSRWKLHKTLVDIHVLLAQKASAEHDPAVARMLRSESARLSEKARKVLQKCVEVIKADERMASLLGRFQEIDGVGVGTAVAVLAEMPEIGQMDDAAAVKLAGLAPKEHQSAKNEHTRQIYAGRRNLRNALYMAAVPAIRHNHILRASYQNYLRRIPTPKAKKWALVPIMRKLIRLMNRLARDPGFKLEKKPPRQEGASPDGSLT